MSVWVMLMAFLLTSTSSSKAGDAIIFPIFIGGGQSAWDWSANNWVEMPSGISGQVALRAVNMDNQSITHVGPEYAVASDANWHLEYSMFLSWQSTYQIRFWMDQDPSLQDRFVVMDPITAWPNYYGNSDTMAGQGILSDTFLSEYGRSTVVQQTLDMSALTALDATYSYRMEVLDMSGNIVGSHTITVDVGNGALPPDIALLVDVNGAKVGTTTIVDYIIPGGVTTFQDRVDALRIKHAANNKKYKAAVTDLANKQATDGNITQEQARQVKEQATL